jgi:Kef-type K+ transport system membrane component KefB
VRSRIDLTGDTTTDAGGAVTLTATPGLSWVYLVIVALLAATFAAIALIGPAVSSRSAARISLGAMPKEGGDLLARLLVSLVAVNLTGRLIGVAFAHKRQPRVIGEILAGVLLGPSLLGAVFPDLTAYLFPPRVLGPLGLVGQLGVILYMFLVGAELDGRALRTRVPAAIAISHASIVVPFVLGCVLAFGLYRFEAPPGVPFLPFAMFLGVAMAVTAFPVLARVLKDRGLDRTPLGTMALSVAAVDDVTAWMLLAGALATAQSHVSRALTIPALTAVYVAAMFLIVRPLLAEFLRAAGRSREGAIAAALLHLLASAMITEAIGIHAVFGAFVAGLTMPADSVLTRDLGLRVESLTTAVLLPSFFAVSGLRTEIAQIGTAGGWVVCALVVFVASAGKFGGTYVVARRAGLAVSTAAPLGILMNTRGLMELVVLNVGLDAGIISIRLFTMMVLMAVITTISAGPLLNRFHRGKSSSHSCL